jgi:hypothetical protein
VEEASVEEAVDTSVGGEVGGVELALVVVVAMAPRIKGIAKKP